MYICPTSAGNSSKTSAWYRYWRGDVLQMTTGTGQVLLDVFLGQIEGINTVIG